MKERLNWGLLSKYRTELYGIAALMIMIFHCQVIVPISGVFAAVNYHLNFGVDIFLLLSGMSLYYSYSKNNNYTVFIKNRCERTLLPYLIIGFFYWVWSDIFVQSNILDFLLNATGLSLILTRQDTFFVFGSPAFWYVAFIMGMYVIYPTIYKAFFTVTEKKKRINFVFLFTFSIALTVLIRLSAFETYERAEVWLTRIPVFLTGCYIGKAVKEKQRFKMSDYLLFFVFIPFKAVILLIRPVFDDHILHRYLGMFTALFICFAVVAVFEILNISPIRKVFSFFGKISLEVYMLHCMLYQVVLHYIPDLKESEMFTFLQKVLIYAGILGLSTVLSFLFSKAFNELRKRMVRK